MSDSQAVTLTREEMLTRFVWVGGGLSFQDQGLAMRYALDTPAPGKPDFPSIVGLYGTPDEYTEEELAQLVKFAEQVTAYYDRRFSSRRGANLYLFGKSDRPDLPWLRKKLSWTQGPMYSPTLEEAIAFMTDVFLLVAS